MDSIRREGSPFAKSAGFGSAILLFALFFTACALNVPAGSTGTQTPMDPQPVKASPPAPAGPESSPADSANSGGFAPSYEMLMEAMADRQRMLERESPGNNELLPFGQAGSRNASWGPVDRPFTEKGEYSFGPPDVVPIYGCNADPNNSSDAGNAIEDVLVGVDTSFFPYFYVYRGPGKPNHFNGRNREDNWNCFVGQSFVDTPPGEMPTAMESYTYFAGDTGIGPGGTCFSYPEYPVNGTAWFVFNRTIDCTPGLNLLKVFEIMPVATGEMSGEFTSSGQTTGSFQPFLFGTIEACYGGAEIFTAISTDSPCDYFRNYMPTQEDFQHFFSNPVLGLHLLRWQNMARSDQAGPWETDFGWPVFGPWAWLGGSPIYRNGAPCYVWCMWYERGFIFWLDYDNDGPLAPFPEVPDEAMPFLFTGDNVYCQDGGEYVPLQKMYYGDGGSLQTNIVPLNWRKVGESNWQPMDFRWSNYVIPVTSSQTESFQIAFFARGYGGDPDGEYRYKYYSWDLGNGQTQPPGNEYDPDQQYATGVYRLPAGQQEQTFRVTVDVTDELITTTSRSFPIILTRNPDE